MVEEKLNKKRLSNNNEYDSLIFQLEDILSGIQEP